jgi:hypothetical protein
VAEIGLGDLLQQPDVLLEVGQHGLPLLPGERLAGPGAALQHPLQRGGEAGPGGTGQMPADRGRPPDQLRHHPVTAGLGGMRGHVLLGHLCDHARRHAQERADLVQRPGRRVDQVAVAQHQHLLPGE